MRIGLRSITYTVGWYNLETQEILVRVGNSGGITTPLYITAGLYSFTAIQELLEQAHPGISILVSRYDGIAQLSIPTAVDIKFTDQMCAILAIDDGLGGQWLDPGTYVGDRPVSFAPVRALHVHLEQLDTFRNCIDGRPSSLLTTVGIGEHVFGDIATVWIESPALKAIQNGPISELKVVIRDDTGALLDNHDLPISIVLEIVS